MSALNHIEKLQLPDRMNECISNASSMICKDVLESKSVIFVVKEPKEAVREWWKITQSELISPVNPSPYYFDDQLYNEYTNESLMNNIASFSGYVQGDFGKISLPVFNPFDNSDMIVDILGAMIINTIRGNFQAANAYLRAFFMIKSLENKSKNQVKVDEPKADFTIIPDCLL